MPGGANASSLVPGAADASSLAPGANQLDCGPTRCQHTGKQTGARCHRCEQTRTHCHRCEQTRTDVSRFGGPGLPDIALASGGPPHAPVRTHLALPSPSRPHTPLPGVTLYTFAPPPTTSHLPLTPLSPPPRDHTFMSPPLASTPHRCPSRPSCHRSTPCHPTRQAPTTRTTPCVRLLGCHRCEQTRTDARH